MKTNLLKDELFEIISKYTGIEKENLTLEMEILHDLGCSGDDAYDMLSEICIKFNINCKEFHPVDVCEAEGYDIKSSIFNPIYIYKLLFHKEEVSYPSFTINILLNAIKNKKLKSIKPNNYYYAKEVITE